LDSRASVFDQTFVVFVSVRLTSSLWGCLFSCHLCDKFSLNISCEKNVYHWLT
jgi:hypothetical protein